MPLEKEPKSTSHRAIESQSKNEGSEELAAEYQKLLRAYDRKFKAIKNLEKGGGHNDPRKQEQIEKLDQVRHETHLKLVELGKQIGKNEQEIIGDIILMHGNLEEFGLPEFAILDAGALSGFEGARDLKDDEVLLKFDQIVYGGDRMRDEKFFITDMAHQIKLSRCRALAEALGEKAHIASIRDSFYFHEHSMDIVGVVIKKNILEEVAAVIRTHPEQFRLDSQFISEDDKKKIKNDIRLDLTQTFDSILERAAAEYTYQAGTETTSEGLLASKLRLAAKGKGGQIAEFVSEVDKKEGGGNKYETKVLSRLAKEMATQKIGEYFDTHFSRREELGLFVLNVCDEWKKEKLGE